MPPPLLTLALPFSMLRLEMTVPALMLAAAYSIMRPDAGQRRVAAGLAPVPIRLTARVMRSEAVMYVPG